MKYRLLIILAMALLLISTISAGAQSNGPDSPDHHTQTPTATEAIQPTSTQTPWIITATPGATQTPWIITATPGATQTPWVIIGTCQPTAPIIQDHSLFLPVMSYEWRGVTLFPKTK